MNELYIWMNESITRHYVVTMPNFASDVLPNWVHQLRTAYAISDVVPR